MSMSGTMFTTGRVPVLLSGTMFTTGRVPVLLSGTMFTTGRVPALLTDCYQNEMFGWSLYKFGSS